MTGALNPIKVVNVKIVYRKIARNAYINPSKSKRTFLIESSLSFWFKCCYNERPMKGGDSNGRKNRTER